MGWEERQVRGGARRGRRVVVGEPRAPYLQVLAAPLEYIAFHDLNNIQSMIIMRLCRGGQSRRTVPYPKVD